MWKKLVAWAVGAASIVSAAAHGMLSEPRARNVVHNSNYCPHCLAAGGPGVTYAGGRVWPRSVHGVCGDPPKGPLDHEAGGKFATKIITGRYVRGQTLTLRVTITAPHGGRFSFGVCPVPDGASDAEERRVVTQKCFDANRLTNTQDGTPHWWFGKKPTGEYTMDFKLPTGVTCKRCVLQWHYETGNSCTIPGTPLQHVMSDNMVPCDKTGVMEEFWNCADVAIRDDGDPQPKSHKKKKKAAPAASTKEGFVSQPGLPDPAAAAALSELVTLISAVALVYLVVPPVLALSGGVGLVVWYLVYVRARQRVGFVAPRVQMLPPAMPREARRRVFVDRAHACVYRV